jgi:hypothetical protein
MFSRFTPDCSRILKSGRKIPFSPLYGAGRVISETVTQTLNSAADLPFDWMISGKVGDPMGWFKAFGEGHHIGAEPKHQKILPRTLR